ncbi:MAG: hypothetical protein KW788_02155 [Candidatus Doudnabacteria bacterium]|nr:hypothetical protein [Candidatus Doudnabacteria bacterium]
MATGSTKGGMLTNGDLDKIAGLLDDRMAPLATKLELKDEITGLEKNLKTYMHEGFEAVMAGMDSLSEQLAEKEKVDRLVDWAKEASKKIGVNLDI